MKERKLTKQEERRKERYPETLTFHWHNENPKGHITGDCVIRALAGAMGISWEEAHTGLRDTEAKYALCDMKAIEKYLEAAGWVKHKQPRKADGKKVTGSEMCRVLTDKCPNGEIGNVICSVAHHLYCIKPIREDYGTVYKVVDIWDSTGKTIGNWWTKGE